MSRFRSRFNAGDLVQVRSRDAILSTLDDRGALEGLPFMPEMLEFCGRSFRVSASAHKTCDTVHGTGGRRMRDAVHLDGVRCNGAGHDGCQARCLIFWKEAWLEAVADGAPESDSRKGGRAGRAASGALRPDESTLVREACDRSDPASPTYSCQATRLYEATSALPFWAPWQYVADVRSGNVPFREAVRSLLLACLYNLRRLGIGYRFFCALYERVHRRLMGTPSPYLGGTIRSGSTPICELGLRPGELVVVRPVEEIVRTLNPQNRNRGMSFDKEMVRYCGQRFRVLDRVRRIIHETTGKMLEFATPSVMLEGAYCTSRYSERRLLCPRRVIPFWREVWLERVSAAADPPDLAAEPDSGGERRDRSPAHAAAGSLRRR